jgi:hypothetical protein
MSLENFSSFKDGLSCRDSCEVFEYLVFFMGISKAPSFRRENLEKNEFKNSKVKGCLGFWPHRASTRTLKQIGT